MLPDDAAYINHEGPTSPNKARGSCAIVVVIVMMLELALCALLRLASVVALSIDGVVVVVCVLGVESFQARNDRLIDLQISDCFPACGVQRSVRDAQ